MFHVRQKKLRMSRLSLVCIFLLTALLFFGCSDDDDDDWKCIGSGDIFYDNFDDDNYDGWEANYAQAAVENGELKLMQINSSYFASVTMDKSFSNAELNFYFAVKFNTNPNSDEIVICHIDLGSSYYYYEGIRIYNWGAAIREDNRVALFFYTNYGWLTWNDYHTCDSFKSNDWNCFQVNCTTAGMRLYVNGVEANVADFTVNKTPFGEEIKLYTGFDNVWVWFDEVAVSGGGASKKETGHLIPSEDIFGIADLNPEYEIYDDGLQLQDLINSY